MSRLTTLVTCFALGVVLSLTMAQSSGTQGRAANEVIALAKAEWAAEMSKNTSEATRNMHQDCTMWVRDYPNRLDGKDTIYKFYEAGSTGAGDVVFAEMANEKVQNYGNVAVLTYNYMGMNKDKEGVVKPMQAKSTRVYFKDGGKWLLVHANFAPVANPED